MMPMTPTTVTGTAGAFSTAPAMTPAQIAAQLEAPDPSQIKTLWDDIDSEMRVTRREYVLNRSFDRGDQWIRWDATTVDAILREFRSQTETDTRTTVNKFRARRRDLTARTTATPLSFDVRASSAAEDGIRKQRLAEHVLLSLHDEQEWEKTRAANVKATFHGGNAAIAWEWDPDLTTAPPAVDPNSGTLLPAGGVRLTALTNLEFGLEPGSREQRAATWWLRCVGLTPRQAQIIYKLPKEPPPDSAARTSAMGRILSGQKGVADTRTKLCSLYVYTRRPTPLAPGVIVHSIGGQIVQASGWPFPEQDRLNLYVFACDDPDDTWICDPFLSDARQIQIMYNDVRTVIREHAQRAANARIIVPEGALDDLTAFTDQPGEVVEYRGEKPEWMRPPDANRFLSNEVDRLDNELNDVLNSPDVARGIAPGDRNSGAALALLAEKADGPLGPFARDQAAGWSVIGTQVMRLMRHQMPEGQERVSTTYGEAGIPMKRTWTKADIDPEIRVTVPIESTEPRSQVAVRAALVDLQRSFPQVFQNLDPATLGRMMGLSSVRQMLVNQNPHEAYAAYENEVMLGGQPCIPDEWNDHGTHIVRHEALRNSATYDQAGQLVQEILDQHIAAHKKLAFDAQMQAMQTQQQQQQLALPAGAPAEGPGEGEAPAEDQGEPQPEPA